MADDLKARVAELEARLRNVAVCICGDAWVKRGLHAPECHADEGLLDDGTPTLDALLDAAEARGRAHCVLAATWLLEREGERLLSCAPEGMEAVDRVEWNAEARAHLRAAMLVHVFLGFAEAAHDA